jgi:hypothetical protein
MVSNEEKLLKERIRMLLAKKGLTILDLADGDEVVAKRYRNQINGDALVPYSTLYKLLYMFHDISADWLVMGEGAISKADCAAPRIYNTKNEVHDSKAGGDILVGATTIPCSVQSIINEKDKRIAELERDKELLSGLLSAFTKK